MEGAKRGKLLKYDIAAKETSVVLDGLVFPTGVVVSPDGESIFCEGTRMRYAFTLSSLHCYKKKNAPVHKGSRRPAYGAFLARLCLMVAFAPCCILALSGASAII